MIHRTALVLGMLILPSLGYSHDFATEGVTQMTPPTDEDLSDVDVDLPESALRAVLDQYKLWDAGQTISVCFMDGDPEAKEYFVAVSQLWDKLVSTDFEFGTPPNFNDCNAGDFEIRVTLKSSGGNWSYVGSGATNIDQSKPTLSVATKSPFKFNKKRQLQGTILHELGHALALAHEHQSPESNCEAELVWDRVYADLGGPPNNWDKDKVDLNVRSLPKNFRYRTSPYDPKSVMHYAFPVHWFENGKQSSCFIEKNNSLSDLDEAAAKEIYPPTPSQQDDFIAKIDAVTASRLAESNLSEQQIQEVEKLINRSLDNVPDRSVKSSVSNQVKAITSGDCSPVITDAGDVVLNCSTSSD